MATPAGTSIPVKPGAKIGTGGNGKMTGSGENGLGPEQRTMTVVSDDSVTLSKRLQMLVPVRTLAWSPTSSVPFSMKPCLPSWTRPPASLTPTLPESMKASLPSRARCSPSTT